MKIVLIEFNSYHHECIYSQVRFLKEEGANVTLIISPKAKSKISSYIDIIDNVYYYDKKASYFFLKKFFILINLYRFIASQKFDKVIFNTASSSKTLIFITMLLRFTGVECMGTIHNLRKMSSSFSQKLIYLNIKKYFVINDFLLNSAKISDPKARLSSYYPIFYPNYKSVNLNKPKGEKWICIPGEVNFKRRDYTILIESLIKSEYKNNLKFIILGKLSAVPKDSEVFLKLVKESGLENHFITFDTFVENDLFFSYLKAADYILANLQLNDDSYMKYKVSGVLNLALGFKKLLIIPSALNIIKDLSENTFMYETSSELSQIFDTISKNYEEPTYIFNKKMDFDNQRKKYIDFINSERIT